jgi:hypothetical protein
MKNTPRTLGVKETDLLKGSFEGNKNAHEIITERHDVKQAKASTSRKLVSYCCIMGIWALNSSA